jgi:hypothetical protein
VSLLYPEDWADIGKQTVHGRPRAFMLERALLADRSAAFYGQYTIPTSRTVANALHVGTTTRWWWEPIRRQMLRYSGVPEDVLDRNLEGLGAIDPATVNQPHMAGVDTDVNVGAGVSEVEPLATPGTYTPLVTYISRQSSRRRLTPESHADLVQHLEDRAKTVGFELVIVEAEKLSMEDQFALAGRTTVSTRCVDTWGAREYDGQVAVGGSHAHSIRDGGGGGHGAKADTAAELEQEPTRRSLLIASDHARRAR